MIAPTNIACQPPIAPIGTRVALNLAALFVHDEGCHGVRINYMGQHLLVKRQDVLGVLDKQQQLIHIQTAGILTGFDGCVSYTVRVDERAIHVHRQNIIAVLRESEVV